MTAAERAYTPAEELANGLTHGIGFLVSVAGLCLLAVFAALRGTAVHVVSGAIYGTTLVSLYAASTLYHSVRNPRAKRVLKRIDHAAIYLLIAGTYTPFALVVLRGAWGWTIFGVSWGLALAGVVSGIVLARRRVLRTVLYIGMGWLAVVAVRPLFERLSPTGLGWLLAGGLFYTAGTVFYLRKDVPFLHAVWHVFVLAGSLCHLVSVLGFVMPRR